MFGSLGMPEIILIAVLVALLFGGKRFAEMGRGLGQGIRGFKDAVSGKDNEP